MQSFQTTDMIPIGMGQHQKIDLVDAVAAERGGVCNDVRAGVDGDHLSSGRNQQDGIALTDVEKRHSGNRRRRHRQRDDEERRDHRRQPQRRPPSQQYQDGENAGQAANTDLRQECRPPGQLDDSRSGQLGGCTQPTEARKRSRPTSRSRYGYQRSRRDVGHCSKSRDLAKYPKQQRQDGNLGGQRGAKRSPEPAGTPVEPQMRSQ